MRSSLPLDYSGCPDCRPEYLAAYERMANLATAAGVAGRQHLRIHAPLLALTTAVAALDYRYLNDRLPVPTDENLARWLRDRLAAPARRHRGWTGSASAPRPMPSWSCAPATS